MSARCYREHCCNVATLDVKSYPLDGKGWRGDWGYCDQHAPEVRVDSVIAALVTQVAETGGASVDRNGWAPTSGYMVATHGTPATVLADPHAEVLFPAIRAHIIAATRDLQDGRFVGYWRDSETGDVYLDVAENVANRDEALRLAASRHEIAIWDVVAGEEVRVDYDDDAAEFGIEVTEIDGVKGAVRTAVKQNSILRETPEGTFYTGPLGVAIKVLRAEYGDDLVTIRTDGMVTIEERRGAGEGCNQWGTGPDEETAWRYLIGADFGPLDETYEAEGYESTQRRMLGLGEVRS